MENKLLTQINADSHRWKNQSN